MSDKNAGTISIRLAVKDAEVVRRALENLGKDGEKSLNKLNKGLQDGGSGNRFSFLKNVLGEFASQAEGTTFRLGALGSGLRALGPIGIAAGAVIGTISAATLVMANATAQAAQELSVFYEKAQLVGLTTDMYQALGMAAAEAGVRQEKFATGLTKFADQSAEASKGQGELYETIYKYNVELAKQFRLTDDQAKRLEILRGVFQSLSSPAEKVALSNAAFGKGGMEMANFFTEAKTSLDEMTKKTKEMGGIIDKELLERADQIADKYERISNIMKNEWLATIMRIGDHLFGIDKYYDGLLQISTKGRRFIERKALPEQKQSIDTLKETVDTSELLSLKEKAEQTQGTRFGQVHLNQYREGLREVFDAAAELRARQEKEAKGDIFGQFYDMVGIKQPKAEEPSQPQDQRSKDATFEERKAIQDRIAALGELAQVREGSKLKELELNEAVRQGKISTEDASLALQDQTNKMLAQRVAVRVREGLATASERLVLKESELNQEMALGRITQDEKSKAMELYGQELEHVMRIEEIRKSRAPALMTIVKDAENLRGTLDQYAAQSLNNFGRTLLSVADGSKKAGVAFKEFAKDVVSGLAQIAIQRQIIAPLADALIGPVSKINNGGTTGGGGLFGGVGDFLKGLWPFENGGIMSPYGSLPLRAYASGGVAHTPQLALYGEGRMPEAYVPLPNGRSIPVEMRGGMGGTNVELHIHEAQGVKADVKQSKGSNGGVRFDVMMQREIEDAVVTDIAQGGGISRAMESKFGLKRQV